MWEGVDEWRAECARVTLHEDGLTAHGVQMGAAYRLDYVLVTGEGFVTRMLHIDCWGNGWHRRLLLRRLLDGTWDATGGERRASVPGLAGALDCDLGFSPLTNTMPVLRHRLHERAGAEDFLMAWVAVPELTVHASAQRYEHVRPGVVRYVDRGTHDGFTAELELDEDGFAVLYPGLARRVEG